MESYDNHTAIRSWAENDRPREKLMLKGRHSLSDTELLAILIGSGTRNESAVDLAKKILRIAQDNLGELSRLSLNDLLAVKGIGRARAVTILAALELGRRRNESEVLVREKISTSRDAYEIFKSVIGDRPYEEFWIILLNKANRVLKKCNISEGGISGTVVDPKKVFKISLDNHASSIILGHNHPSGVVTPSEADRRITKKLLDAGIMLEVTVLDHLIIGDGCYYSFADEGAL
ncbi:MAG TPA: DNA repair protein RadC [Bacteroidales bacterium]|nr:DNA repair protein RadC [Bacteroidales bacterium]HPS63001.1 DNA repair protein RadC [Bacteroidales bacterium]